MNTQSVRLQKYLSERGIASRRHASEIIKSGRVSVNGKPALQPGHPVEAASAEVTLDGKIIPNALPEHRTILMNKPRGYICSRSSKQGKTIYDLLPKELHNLLPVGRLDKNSEGLLLLSNDGDLINRLTHPRYEQEKVYHVSVSGDVNGNALEQLNSPMDIEGYLTQPAKVRILKDQPVENRTKLEFILKEGRKRQIRHMCENVSLKVHRLLRVKIKELTNKGLKSGKWRALSDKEEKTLSKHFSD